MRQAFLIAVIGIVLWVLIAYFFSFYEVEREYQVVRHCRVDAGLFPHDGDCCKDLAGEESACCGRQEYSESCSRGAWCYGYFLPEGDCIDYNGFTIKDSFFGKKPAFHDYAPQTVFLGLLLGGFFVGFVFFVYFYLVDRFDKKKGEKDECF